MYSLFQIQEIKSLCGFIASVFFSYREPEGMFHMALVQEGVEPVCLHKKMSQLLIELHNSNTNSLDAGIVF